MLPSAVFRLTKLSWQLGISLAFTTGVGLCVIFPHQSHANISSLDQSTYIAALGTVATLVALFCSLSIAWILFISQQARAERLLAYDTLKARLLTTQQWLLSLPKTKERELCLSLAYELDKHSLSDLPQTDLGPEYIHYCMSLDAGLQSDDPERRTFFLISSMHFGYIEGLLNRIGLVSIRQIVTHRFISTLAKGFALAGISVFALIISIIWYNETIRPILILAAAFVSTGSVLLLVEVWIDLRRSYDDDIDFIDSAEKEG